MKEEIRQYALSACYEYSLLSGLIGWVPYNYHWNPKSYSPRPPNILLNKFEILTLHELEELNKMFQEDKDAFHQYLSEFIQREEILFEIEERLNKHHILDLRSDIMRDAINLYRNGSNRMFALVIPAIIEGIFHDLCLTAGENENELFQLGLKEKLDKLHQVLGAFLYYEYYAFSFRLLRNKVAHGRLSLVDMDEIADLLLLDLHQVCKLVFSNRFDLNHKRFVVDELYKNRTNPDYKFLVKYLLLSEIDIPASYDMGLQIKEVEKLISSRKSFDKRCTALLKKAGIKKTNMELANQYFRYLTRDF